MYLISPYDIVLLFSTLKQLFDCIKLKKSSNIGIPNTKKNSKNKYY